MRALNAARRQGLDFDPHDVSFFASREKIVPSRGGAATWGERLFAAMSRNAGSVTDYFNIPDNRVIELGTRIQL